MSYMSDFDALDKLDAAGGCDRVELGQDLAGVRGQGDQDVQFGQGHQAHVGLGVGPEFGLGHQINGILLGLQPGGQKIAIPHEFAIVHAKVAKIET